MKHLYFIRHGESELNAQRIFAGQTDTPLNDIGRKQAKAAGEQAKSEHFDAIVSSPLQRALETARIIAQEIGYPPENVAVNAIFQERSLGSLEGMSWDAVDEHHTTAADVESWDSLLERARQGLEILRTLEADTVLLVSHGSYIRALQEVVDPRESHPEPANAQIVQLF